MKNEFSTLEVAKILGIPRERFRQWMKDDFIRPSAQVPSGSGTRAIFNVTDLYRITLFRNLLEHVHLDRFNAAACANALREQDLKRDFAIFRTDVTRINQRVNVRTKEVETVSKDVSWDVVQTCNGVPKINFEQRDNVLVVNLGRIREYVKDLLKE